MEPPWPRTSLGVIVCCVCHVLVHHLSTAFVSAVLATPPPLTLLSLFYKWPVSTSYLSAKCPCGSRCQPVPCSCGVDGSVGVGHALPGWMAGERRVRESWPPAAPPGLHRLRCGFCFLSHVCAFCLTQRCGPTSSLCLLPITLPLSVPMSLPTPTSLRL